MKSLVLMRKLLVFSVFLLLTQHLSAQSDIEALEKSGLKEVFKSVIYSQEEYGGALPIYMYALIQMVLLLYLLHRRDENLR